MLHARFTIFFLAAALNSVLLADTCTVTTGVELQTALNNHCQHIIIPATDSQSNPVVIDVPFQFNGNQVSSIFIGNAHDGMQLTINGTINWVGGNNSGYKVVQINGASNITIDGTGLLTSSEDPSSNAYIAWAIRILDATNISISDLSFENLSSMVQQESGYVNGLSLSNLHGEELTRYGVFVSDGSNIGIEDCSVGDANNSQITGTYNEHGFRIYARNYPDTGNVSILNCSAHNVADTGLWIVEGDDITVDGFTSNKPLRIGPNFSCKDAGLDTGDGNGNPQQRVRRAEVKNISVLYVQVEMGRWAHIYRAFTGASSIGIGRVPGITQAQDDTVVARPLNNVHWKDVNVTPGVASADCIGDNVGPLCDRADVNQDSTVNVTDLLAVIDAWGTYTPWSDVPLGGYCDGSNPACGPGHCHYNDVSTSPSTVEPADVAKSGGLWPDGVVNVTDLLAILNNWGTCTEKDGIDQATQDCMDYATYELELEPYSVE